MRIRDVTPEGMVRLVEQWLYSATPDERVRFVERLRPSLDRVPDGPEENPDVRFTDPGFARERPVTPRRRRRWWRRLA